MSIAIITENFPGLWNPNDLESFLGGGQESVVYLAEELGATVFLFGITPSPTTVRKNIVYQDFSQFTDTFQTVILFKINPLTSKLKANVIFWSSDVQTTVLDPFNNIQRRVCLTEYHRSRNGWVSPQDTIIPLGIDRESLEKNRVPKEDNTMLYSASLDRGFDNLVRFWATIQAKYPGIRLYVTYGLKLSQQFDPGKADQVKNMGRDLATFCEKKGINFLGTVNKEEMERLYWRCKYWVHPLNKADAELFCLNAIKAQLCGCIPVVYRLGALQETVGDYIDFDDFVQGSTTIRKMENKVPTYSWKEVGEMWRRFIEGSRPSAFER